MKRYTHALTDKLNPETWKEVLNLDALSQDDLVNIFGDMKAMESFSKKVAGFLREVIVSRMPEDEDEYDSSFFHIQRNYRERAGGLDKDLIIEDMGEDWVENHTKEPTEYVELRITRLEE